MNSINHLGGKTNVVDTLKNQNAFTKEAQEEAFKRSYDAVMSILSVEAKAYLETAVGDLNAYIVCYYMPLVDENDGGIVQVKQGTNT